MLWQWDNMHVTLICFEEFSVSVVYLLTNSLPHLLKSTDWFSVELLFLIK